MTEKLQETIDAYESILQAVQYIDTAYQALWPLANKKIVTENTTNLALDLQKAIINCRRDAQFNLKELYREKSSA